jgi:hypothetical protein
MLVLAVLSTAARMISGERDRRAAAGPGQVSAGVYPG